jgi:hypothetical protein
MEEMIQERLVLGTGAEVAGQVDGEDQCVRLEGLVKQVEE